MRKAITITTKALVEKDPQYSYAVSFTFDELLVEADSVLFPERDTDVLHATNTIDYTKYFTAYIQKAVTLELLHPSMLEFDLDKLVRQ